MCLFSFNNTGHLLSTTTALLQLMKINWGTEGTDAFWPKLYTPNKINRYSSNPCSNKKAKKLDVIPMLKPSQNPLFYFWGHKRDLLLFFVGGEMKREDYILVPRISINNRDFCPFSGSGNCFHWLICALLNKRWELRLFLTQTCRWSPYRFLTQLQACQSKINGCVCIANCATKLIFLTLFECCTLFSSLLDFFCWWIVARNEEFVYEQKMKFCACCERLPFCDATRRVIFNRRSPSLQAQMFFINCVNGYSVCVVCLSV